MKTMLSLKEDDTYLVLSETGWIEAGAEGAYRHDTRFFSRYRLDLPGFRLLTTHQPRPDRLVQHWGLLEGPTQAVGLRRTLEVHRGGWRDRLVLENTSLEPRTLELALEAEADYKDLFEVRGWARLERRLQREAVPGHLRFRYRAEDGLEFTADLRLDPPAPGRRWRVTLEPKGTAQLTVEARLESPLAEAGVALPDYAAWRAAFPLRLRDPRAQAVLERAVDDLRALLFATPYGPYPAAGIPWFVAAFGRDALLTAYMTLPWGAEVARGVLRYLAAHQGRDVNPENDEAPGKILHEVRLGELSRTGRVPFRAYYGTVDATPLFVILLEAYARWTGDLALVRALRPHWEAALEWMLRYGDADGDGLLEFAREGEGGLVVQSWKDSHDSMSHADGRLAEPPLAVSEVQAYAYRAYTAAAAFYRALGEPERARAWTARAEALKRTFHARFWLEDLGTYALALDREKRPLRVKSSDPGHLLWCGIVPEAVAPRLVATLFSEELWSGWGLRTLGAKEVRYNPLSYHNGSVWPHDTALFAGGLARYGFKREALRVVETLFELAFSQPDLRLPELVGGCPREAGEPPVPYLDACRPQAWDAAALVYLVRLAWSLEPDGRYAAPPGLLDGWLA